jgi:cellulose synthase/poly-beta-1,6-N-acetylglucosamine synthase-like glycosyltransferase
MSIVQFLGLVISFATNITLLISAIVVFIICLIFFLECIAALLPNKDIAYKGNWQNTKVTVLIPAHNEEIVIASTLEKIIPPLKKEDSVVVVADNCTDATANIAREKGATVIERYDAVNKGKGYALDYGLCFLDSKPPDIVIFVDADCVVENNAIERLTEWAIATQQPVQASYLMEKAQNSHSSKDYISQFSIIIRNFVRLRGGAFFGFPSMLNGTGMAFPWSVIRRVNVANAHLLEDLKLGMDLTIAGHKPIFCPEAKVMGYLPSSLEASKNQKTRWEHGHLQLMQTYIPKLLKEAVSQKRFGLLLSIPDLFVPPLSLLVITWLGTMVISLFFGVLGVSWLATLIVSLGGLFFFTAILTAWYTFARKEFPLGELLAIPLYVLWKIPVYIKFIIKPEKKWIRTERENTP